MLCPNCSTDVPAGSSFCPKCGGKLPAAAEAGSPTPAERLRTAQAASAANNEPEQPLWNGGYSPKAMYGSWLLAGLATVAGIVVSVLVPPPAFLIAGGAVILLWLYLLGYYLIARWSVDYTLSTQRLTHRRGILRQVTDRIEVIDIDDVSYTQGIIERMFGVGTIKLLSSDTSDPTLTMRGIDDVQRVANLIDNARREERRKRGLYMEKV